MSEVKKFPKVITLLYRCAEIARRAEKDAMAEIERQPGHLVVDTMSPGKVYHLPDLCGRAWINIGKCNRFPNSTFVKWFKRLAAKRGRVLDQYWELPVDGCKFVLTKNHYLGGYTLTAELSTQFHTVWCKVHGRICDFLKEQGLEVWWQNRLE